MKEYIRGRRLTFAFKALLDGEKCIDVALRYGYQAESSFQRAFKKQHGITPREVKKKSVAMKVQPKLHFQNEQDAFTSIIITLKKLPSQIFYGVSKEVDIRKIPPVAESLWKEVKQTVFLNQKDLVGLSYQKAGKYYYASASRVKDESLEKIVFPQGLWISLSSSTQKSQEIKEKFETIYQECLSSFLFSKKDKITRELEIYKGDFVECLVW